MEQQKPKDPQKELEILVSELEERVDRLRALYEQYFMGYEKLEPTIVRKDVDRRFAFLRKQQIRNTALRFKFNVITQKFQTYAMYWARICRQIEDGTYKRHVLKAARRFADTEAKTAAHERDKEQSIDVDLADFDETELEALLREVDAESAAFDRAGFGSDTVPPGMPSLPPPELQGAIVPLSAKPRVVLKKRDDAPVPAARPAAAAASAPRPGEAAPVARPGPAPAIRPMPGAPGAIARPMTPANAMRPVPAIRPAGSPAQGAPGQAARPAATPAAENPAARPPANAPAPARPAPPAAQPAAAGAPAARPAAAPGASPVARPAPAIARPPTPAAPAPPAPAPTVARPAPAPTRVPTPQGPLTPQAPAAKPVGTPQRLPLPSTTRTTPAAPFVPAGTPRPAPAAPGTPLRTPATPGGELQRPLIRRTPTTPDRGEKKGP